MAKIKPAGKALIALAILIPTGIFVYNNYVKESLQGEASVSGQSQTASTSNTDPASQEQGGVVKEVEVVKTDTQGNVVKDATGAPLTETRKERVYNVCLSQWPGHMAGIIACEGLTTQPGSFCSTVRSSYGGAPGIQLQYRFIEDPVAKNAALIKGECDFVWQTVDELPLNYPAYQNAGVDAQAFVQIDWSRGGDACVAANGIKSPADLLENGKGAALMSFTPDHTLFEYWITNSTLTAQQVGKLRAATRRHDTDPTFGANLFIQGTVDVACLWEPDVSNALRERPGSYRVFDTSDATTLIADVLLTRDTLLQKNPSAAEKVARVFMEGGRLGRADLDRAAKLVSTAVPRFRDELGLAGTRKAFGWVRWNDLGDNTAMFGLQQGGHAKFDTVYQQAEGIWGEYKDPSTGNPVLEAKFMPHRLRNGTILSRIYAEAEKEREAAQLQIQQGDSNPGLAAKAAPIAPERPTYNPEVARLGQAKLRKAVTINFATGSKDLNVAGRNILKKQVLNQLRLAEGMSLRVEGNTDNTGGAKMNKRLSQARAESVRVYLIQQGIDPDRIASLGNGEDNPLCNVNTADCRARNRRTDIVFVSISAQ